MSHARIARRAYLRLEQSQLAEYADNIVQCCLDHPAFESLQPNIRSVQAALQIYRPALAEAVPGGRDRTARKNIARQALEDALNDLALGMEYLRLTPETILIAGMTPARPSRPQQTPIEAPKAVTAIPTRTSGEIEVSFTVPDPARVRSNAVEYSLDGGATWITGAAGTRGRLLLSGLPRRQEIELRVRSIGSRGRCSAWTEGVRVFVT